jgi:tRNA/rRNA methyltransferase
MKNKFGFILVKPQLGENIGACARSLKNFGFSKLNIVSPKQVWPNNKAKVTSVGAFDIIKKAKIFNNTHDAIGQYDIIISLSARRRDINKKHITINQFLKIIQEKNNTKFALMFGPEASGLSNNDLSLSNYVLQIPTSKKFKSLNLSHSLTVICYEIFKIINYKKLKKTGKNLKISSKNKISSLIFHLEKLLDKKGFFVPVEKKHSMIMNINNLFYRLEPNDKEVRILASIISSLSKKNINHN